MYLLTNQEMQWLDKRSIDHYKIPSIRLMERAGSEVYKVISQTLKNLQKKRIAIFCGPGNNGGDGLVVARLLKKKGCFVDVYLLADPPLPPLSSGLWRTSKERGDGERKKKPDLIVDALFGTGLSRPVKGKLRKLITWLNSLDVSRLSIDIPSGLSADTGKVLGAAVKADITVTLGYPKRGFFFGEASQYVGKIHVVDIGLDPRACRELSPQTHLITTKEISLLNRPRKKNTHKGTYGHVYVIGCSAGKIGAGVMAAYSALQVGCGLSTLILPKSAYQKINPHTLEIMYEPVEDNRNGYFLKNNLQEILRLTQHASVVALGPGLGTHQSTVQFVHQFVQKYCGPLVIDADGINAIALSPAILKKRKGSTLLTPHPGEMGRLIRKSTKYVQAHRLEVVASFAQKYNVIVLLKGYRSLISFPDGKVWINPTGNPAMAQAGQGDLLTGIYAGLIAQFSDDRSVYLAGTFLHGLVGDLLAQKGNHIVMAMDIAKNLILGYSFLRKKKHVLSSIFY